MDFEIQPPLYADLYPKKEHKKVQLTKILTFIYKFIKCNVIIFFILILITQDVRLFLLFVISFIIVIGWFTSTNDQKCLVFFCAFFNFTFGFLIGIFVSCIFFSINYQ